MAFWDDCCEEAHGEEMKNLWRKIQLYTSMKFLKENVKNKEDFDRIITEMSQFSNTYINMLNDVLTLAKSKPETDIINHINYRVKAHKQDNSYHRSKFIKNIKKVSQKIDFNLGFKG
jgi:hypothetical protein